MKNCNKCNTELIIEKNWTEGRKRAYYYICTPCKSKKEIKWFKNNPDKKAKSDKKWAQNNKEKCNKIKRKWAKNNPDKLNARTAKRRAKKLDATPPWSDLNKIVVLYEKAKWLESITGLKYHVDHIIPLQGKDVCGLHVWHNLQILEKSENIKKGNKYAW